jgi:hypothetical protein
MDSDNQSRQANLKGWLSILRLNLASKSYKVVKFFELFPSVPALRRLDRRGELLADHGDDLTRTLHHLQRRKEKLNQVNQTGSLENFILTRKSAHFLSQEPVQHRELPKMHSQHCARCRWIKLNS